MNSDPPTLKQKIAVGLSAWDREDYQQALEAFDRVLKDHPAFPDIHNKAGLCRAMLGDPEGALEEFDLALRLAPTYAEAHLNRGIVLNELGRHDQAQEAFDEAGRLDTRDGNAFPSDVGNRIAIGHAKLGDLYLIAERPAQAAEEYRQALEVRPRFLDIRSKLGEALIGLGELDEARKELGIVLDGNPEFTAARIRLGVVLQRQGDVEGAVREWERCAEEDPADMRPRAYLATVEREN